MGGEIAMGTTVTAFEKTGDHWRVATSAGTVTGRHVVSSAPVRDVMNAMTPAPKSLPEANKLHYRDFLTVAVMLNKEPKFQDNWIYIHDPAVKVGRVQNFTSWSPQLVPRAGLGCLGLEYFCFEHDSLWDSSDADLAALARRELKHIGLVDDNDVMDAVVVRQPKAYPVYDKDYKNAMNAISAEFARDYPGFHFVGRNGMHKYNNQDHAMMTGILTAENILAGNARFDVWNVNEDAEYHEAGEDRSKALASLRDVPANRKEAG
jgi:protoporphyrinogen oxidase